MSKILSVNDLNKKYVTNELQNKVITDFNLDIYENEFICIVGKSGCGKSTLLKILGGFDNSYDGEVLFKNKQKLSPSTEMIMIFQSFDQLFPWKNVLNNVLFPLLTNNKDGKEHLTNIAKKYINLVGLSDYLYHYPHELSGGMKQRIALARALAFEPSILLMDEPFSSVDTLTKSTLQDMLLDIWRETRTTIVFVTHDISEAVRLSSKVIIMGHSPYSIKNQINNTISYPRDSITPEFAEMCNSISKQI